MPKKDVPASNNANLFKPKKTALAVKHAFKPPVKQQAPVKQTAWEDLDEIADACANGIVGTAEAVNTAIQVQHLVDDTGIKTRLQQVVKALEMDLSTFADSLANIRKLHVNKSGLIVDPDDLAESILIYDQYFQLNTQYVAVTMPLVQEVMAVVAEIHHIVKPATVAPAETATAGEVTNG